METNKQSRVKRVLLASRSAENAHMMMSFLSKAGIEGVSFQILTESNDVSDEVVAVIVHGDNIIDEQLFEKLMAHPNTALIVLSQNYYLLASSWRELWDRATQVYPIFSWDAPGKITKYLESICSPAA